MKLVISFDELRDECKFAKDAIDISNYQEMTLFFMLSQFPEWDIKEAFDFRTLQIDETNREVSIEMRVT